MLENFNQVRY